jgi:hypothetical protein
MKILVNGLRVLPIFLALAPLAEAGVFNMPRFVDPGKNAMGFEPEVVTSDGGGVAANLHYTQGISELNNAFAVLGTGTNVRNFRIGGGFTFDFVPDMDTQPGFGIGAQAIYYRYKGSAMKGVGRLETALVPYLHKSFSNGGGNIIEPFIALPFGPAFRSGTYDWTATLAIGAIFHQSYSSIRFIGEFGADLNKSESYISGGILYQP